MTTTNKSKSEATSSNQKTEEKIFRIRGSLDSLIGKIIIYMENFGVPKFLGEQVIKSVYLPFIINPSESNSVGIAIRCAEECMAYARTICQSYNLPLPNEENLFKLTQENEELKRKVTILEQEIRRDKSGYVSGLSNQSKVEDTEMKLTPDFPQELSSSYSDNLSSDNLSSDNFELNNSTEEVETESSQSNVNSGIQLMKEMGGVLTHL